MLKTNTGVEQIYAYLMIIDVITLMIAEITAMKPLIVSRRIDESLQLELIL